GTVGALVLIVLALQLWPAAARHPVPANSPSVLGGQPPRVESLPHGERTPVPVPPKPHLRTAVTPPPLEEAIPPLAEPDRKEPKASRRVELAHERARAKLPNL